MIETSSHEIGAAREFLGTDTRLLQTLADESDITTLVDRDPYTLPSTKMRVGYYGERHLDYWISGLKDYRAMLDTIARHGGSLVPGDSVLDFGCSTGRVLRHFDAQFPADQQGALHCWGVDISSMWIEWARQNLSPRLRIMHTPTEPRLPLEDRAMALVYAFSVFTHIDEFELAWIAELRRVLRVGGIAYLSVHTERTWELMGRQSSWPLHGFLTRDGTDENGDVITTEALLTTMPRERVVHMSESSPVPRVFQSQEYLQREWGRYFEVLEIIERGAAYHDICVLRRVD